MSNFPKNFETEIVNYDKGDILKAIYDPNNPNPPTISEMFTSLGNIIGSLMIANPPKTEEKNITSTSGDLTGDGFDGNYNTLIVTTLSVNATAEIQGRIGNTGTWKALRFRDESTGVETSVLTSTSLLRANISGITSIRLSSPAGSSNINYCMK